MRLRFTATNDQYGNNVRYPSGRVEPDKLPAIYQALRKEVFIGEPIDEQLSNRGLELAHLGDVSFQPTYGWQLFRTKNGGTAMLEYLLEPATQGERYKPPQLTQETRLKLFYITFHQEEETARRACQIIKEYTAMRPSPIRRRKRAEVKS